MSFVRKEERKRKVALMASLSTLIPIHLETNLSVIWIEWVTPIHPVMMARTWRSTESRGTAIPAHNACILGCKIANSSEIVA